MYRYLVNLGIKMDISGDKDLTKRLKYKKGNEFGEAANEVNKFIEMIQSTINSVKLLGEQNKDIAGEIELSSRVISKGTKHMPANIIKGNKIKKTVITAANIPKAVEVLKTPSIGLTINIPIPK